MPELFPKADFANYKMPEIEDNNHYTQWTSAILGNDKTSCPFAYSGPLTETVLLGNVAYRSGTTVHWDSEKLEAIDNPKANALLKREYRNGFEVRGL